VEALKTNPYIIVGEFFGATFGEADDLALNLGFDADTPQRVEAAVLFELRHNTGNGHTFLPVDKLISATDKLIGVGAENIQEAVESLADSKYIEICPIAGVTACRGIRGAAASLNGRLGGRAGYRPGQGDCGH
jgi:exodeoxyribonuclease V alpha subunit